MPRVQGCGYDACSMAMTAPRSRRFMGRTASRGLRIAAISRPARAPERATAFCAPVRCWPARRAEARKKRSEEHTSELQSRGHLVCRLLLEKKKEHRHRP